MATLVPGLRGTAERIVSEELTAPRLGSGIVPVMGTPALLALMEGAAVACLDDRLDEGTTTVGIFAELEHLAASRIGARVRASAELVSVSGPTLEFECEAREGDKIVGRAKHRRAVVNVERFLAGA